MALLFWNRLWMTDDGGGGGGGGGVCTAEWEVVLGVSWRAASLCSVLVLLFFFLFLWLYSAEAKTVFISFATLLFLYSIFAYLFSVSSVGSGRKGGDIGGDFPILANLAPSLAIPIEPPGAMASYVHLTGRGGSGGGEGG
ncbi:hypothetical protein NL676_013607 [Syzygium grande]|nr:hypothetical protein NL676_013607 [Syzygium grande]